MIAGGIIYVMVSRNNLKIIASPANILFVRDVSLWRK